MKPRSSPKAFTLIEMLVVIAIIALLAAMLVPGVTRGIRRSYQAACMSNLKEAATGLMLYVDDNEQWLPPGKVFTREAEWVSGKEWWYRKRFTLPDRLRARRLRLLVLVGAVNDVGADLFQVMR